jgi:hypothetical protein
MNANSMTARYNNTTTFTCAANRGLYVGTMRTGLAGQTNVVFATNGAPTLAGIIGLWNMYNRVNYSTSLGDTTSSWSYALTTIRAMNGQTNTARVSFVVGLLEDAISARFTMGFSAGASGYGLIGIGLDTTTAYNGFGGIGPSISGNAGTITASYDGALLGFHFLSANESCVSAVSQTFFGSGIGGGVQTGLTVSGRF